MKPWALAGLLSLAAGFPDFALAVDRDEKPARDVVVPLLDRSVFSRTDLIFGAEIGAWDRDGGTAVNNPTARKNVTEARIRVIRWGNWAKFDDMAQGGTTPKLTLAQFNHAIDGIRNLGAIPFIKLPPIWEQQRDGARDDWNLEWLKEIVKNAGSRVQLYEFGNEPDNHNYANWSAAEYARHWKEVVPTLKKYARSLGFEIFVGGPAIANSYPHNVAYIQTLLDETAEEYRKTGDRDFVPDFVSSHTYLTEKESATRANMLARIDAWAEFYQNVQKCIDNAYKGLADPSGAPLAFQIKIADSEFSWTTNHDGTRMNDQANADEYVKAMYQLFRQQRIWLACFFTIASHKGGALDLLKPDGTPKPLYNAYKAVSLSDPLNKAPTSDALGIITSHVKYSLDNSPNAQAVLKEASSLLDRDPPHPSLGAH